MTCMHMMLTIRTASDNTKIKLKARQQAYHIQCSMPQSMPLTPRPQALRLLKLRELRRAALLLCRIEVLYDNDDPPGDHESCSQTVQPRWGGHVQMHAVQANAKAASSFSGRSSHIQCHQGGLADRIWAARPYVTHTCPCSSTARQCWRCCHRLQGAQQQRMGTRVKKVIWCALQCSLLGLAGFGWALPCTAHWAWHAMAWRVTWDQTIPVERHYPHRSSALMLKRSCKAWMLNTQACCIRCVPAVARMSGIGIPVHWNHH